MINKNHFSQKVFVVAILVLALFCVSSGADAENEFIEELRIKAEQGDATAQFNLGFMYCDGEGVPQDYKEAVKWYRMAAEQGNATAQNNLGFMYCKGQGVPQNFVEAYAWFNLAAAQGEEENFKYNRDTLIKNMTPQQIAAGKELSAQLLRKIKDSAD